MDIPNDWSRQQRIINLGTIHLWIIKVFDIARRLIVEDGSGGRPSEVEIMTIHLELFLPRYFRLSQLYRVKELDLEAEGRSSPILGDNAHLASVLAHDLISDS